MSAYEHSRKSPTLQTAARLLAEAGFELAAVPRVEFVKHVTGRGRTVCVPTQLPRPPAEQALATVTSTASCCSSCGMTSSCPATSAPPGHPSSSSPYARP
ncbi:hypothetical protein [Pseudonocardia sp. H11422]|uniref:hypothetical protein n=1 Tax=Pseudonocardia sp. H11422 TaxID=2835866 RepID=UPI0020289C7A|nr:hypothetical protein [Pseudonocardia sp. H11422]